MAYQRKTYDEWDVESLYEGEWSLECHNATYEEAKRTLREYRENCPGTQFRMRKRRYPIKSKAV